MGLTIEPECPQCGAPVAIDELDRLLSCPYCGVRSFLFARDYFRLVLPRNTSRQDLIYAPYLRFKGAIYYCRGRQVKYRLLDITNVGTELAGLPFSLGFRTQGPKLKFITPKIKGAFLKFNLDQNKILERASRISASASMEPLLYRAFIGEVLSLIYFPMYLENNKLVDAVLNRPIVSLNKDINISELTVKNPQWKLGALAAICPQCGWDLKGEKDSVVLACDNCNIGWSASEAKFTRVEVRSVPAREGEAINLPFWRIAVTMEGGGIKINSYADFIRQTGCLATKSIAPEWEEEQFAFWIPAFKIEPKIFLYLANRLSVALRTVETVETVPEINVFPVTLPQREAIESLRIVFASATKDKFKKTIYPALPELKIEPKSVMLVYLPFTETSMELIQQQSSVAFSKAVLRIGRYFLG